MCGELFCHFSTNIRYEKRALFVGLTRLRSRIRRIRWMMQREGMECTSDKVHSSTCVGYDKAKRMQCVFLIPVAKICQRPFVVHELVKEGGPRLELNRSREMWYRDTTIRYNSTLRFRRQVHAFVSSCFTACNRSGSPVPRRVMQSLYFRPS